MRFVLIGATAAMALLGAAVVATAQAQDEKGKVGGGPAAEGKGGGQQQGPRAGESERPKQQPGAGQRESGQRESGQRERDTSPKAAQPQQQRDNDRPKATQQQDKERRKSTQQPQQDKDSSKAAEQQGKDRPKSTQQQDKDRPKATEQQDKDRPKSTEQQQRDKDRSKSMGQQLDRDQDREKSAQPPRGDDKSKAAEGGDKRRAQVSDENRRGAGQRFRETKVERVNRTRINVNVRIGATLPRSIRLHTIPVVIYDVAPAYRGYSYVLLDDDSILVVDARTYEIIDVIPSGSLRADGPRRHLTLSDDQMRFVFSSVSRDRRSDVRVRLALGAEVPSGIELITFPEMVTARVGELESFRYIVTDEGVVVVDPSDHSVVLVISN